MSEYTNYQKNRVFMKYGHDCELVTAEEDEEKRLTLFQRIRKWLNEIRMVSELHNLSDELLRSQGAIMREKKRHLQYFPYTIHPFSDLRKWWETYIVVVLFLQFIIVPIDIGYYGDERYHNLFYNRWWIAFRNTLDYMLVLDIALNFITGYYDYVEKEVVLNLSSIFWRYVKTMFLPHLISSIPTDMDLVFNSYNYKQVPAHMYKLELQLLSLFKALRVHTFRTYLLQSFLVRNVSYVKQLIFFTIFNMGFFIHTITCMLLFLTERAQAIVMRVSNRTLHDLHRPDYEELAFIDKLSPLHTYIYNMYYATQMIWHSGVPNAVMQDYISYILIILMYYTSRVVLVYCLSRIVEIVRAHSSSTNKYNQMVRQLREYMRHKQLPEYTQRRLLAYYEFRFQKSYFRESEILHNLSSQLRQDITMYSCRKLVENVEFFKNIPLALIVRIVSSLKSQVFLVNDVVVRANSPGDAMYFIASGTVMVLTLWGHEICHLQDGDHFGEIALLMNNELRIASVVAIEVCELYRLDRKDFIKAIQPYPDLLHNIMCTAYERIEETSVFDELNRRERLARRYF